MAYNYLNIESSYFRTCRRVLFSSVNAENFQVFSNTDSCHSMAYKKRAQNRIPSNKNWNATNHVLLLVSQADTVSNYFFLSMESGPKNGTNVLYKNQYESTYLKKHSLKLPTPPFFTNYHLFSCFCGNLLPRSWSNFFWNPIANVSKKCNMIKLLSQTWNITQKTHSNNGGNYPYQKTMK